MNRRKTAALLLSIAIHAVIFAVLWALLYQNRQTLLTSTTARQVELSLQDFITPAPPKKPVQKSASVPRKTAQPEKRPKPAAKPKPQPAPQRESVKKASRPKPPEKKSTVPKEKTRSVKKEVSKTEKKVVQTKENEQPPKKPSETQKPLSPLSKLAGALGTPAMPASKPAAPSVAEVADALSESAFKALYKDDFDRFTPDQKKFIKNNLSRIQGITQHYLTLRGYPYIAARLNQDGMNIVEFNLHPNGDISDLKVIKESGSEVLDENSLDTIKTAYKDYPRPKETTKIRFYIYYRLY